MSKSPTNGNILQDPLGFLKVQLLKLDPAGASGFEGLIATALAELTGLTFRLAKSGLQFGRDASTPRGDFAIAMEAKRYKGSLRLEDIAGKIWIAAQELGSEIDVWVLCATSEMGDVNLPKLEKMLEDRGISLLMLDWTEAPLPRLAVLLASVREKVKQWYVQHIDAELGEDINSALAEVAKADAFISSSNQLKKDASAEHSGLSALARFNSEWCELAFSDRLHSKRNFGQYLTVQDSILPAVARPTLELQLENAIHTSGQGLGCVAVLGPEGAGKSWLTARWWFASKQKPILIFGGAQVADLIDNKDPLKTIAQLIAAQFDRRGEGDCKLWERRLFRWQTVSRVQSSQCLRFLVVIDGLNELSGRPWADTIVRLIPVVDRLGGRLVLTCRERYWERDIAPRLAGVRITKVIVGDYEQGELNDLLVSRGVLIDSVPEQVRGFIKNPRICSVALDLLDRLSANIDELTVERLLLEYWRRRLEERGDLISHNIKDFEKLLRSHAQILSRNPSVQFDRDEWREHSGASRRSDGRSVEHDLSDIEEGAFLRIVEDEEGFYEFKPETVPFALGLLVARELQDELRGSNREPAEVIDSIVEEVQGFDLVSEALRAAAGIACFDENYPSRARASLISAWLSLQNISEAGYECLIAYSGVSPTAVLDATEIVHEEGSTTRSRQWLLGALLSTISRERVEMAVRLRIENWLTRWSRIPRILGKRNEQEETRLVKFSEMISERLKSITLEERGFLNSFCSEVSAPEATRLDSVAAYLMATLTRSQYANRLLGWSFAWAITGDYERAEVALAWVIRLNDSDFLTLEKGLNAAVDAFLCAPHSSTGKKACAKALRLLGTIDSAVKAEKLDPRPVYERFHRLEKLCSSDPFDPASQFPENFTESVKLVRKMDPSKLWYSFTPSGDDHGLDSITPALARFDGELIIQLLRLIACQVAHRNKISLRQVSWRLKHVSPLFDSSTLEAVRVGYSKVINDSELLDEQDRFFVAGSILRSILPHITAFEQLELFLQLPAEVQNWYAFRDLFLPLKPLQLELALEGAEKDANDLNRVLFFSSAHKVELTSSARSVLFRALEHEDLRVVSSASEVAYVSQDHELDKYVIEAARKRTPHSDNDDEFFLRSKAVAAAIVSLRSLDDVILVDPQLLGYVSEQLGNVFDLQLLEVAEKIFERLLLPIDIKVPDLGRLYVEVGRKGQDTCRSVKDRLDSNEEKKLDDLVDNQDKIIPVSDGRQSIDRFVGRQEAIINESNEYISSLRDEKAFVLAREPDLIALKRLVKIYPDKMIVWAKLIVKEKNSVRLSNVRNFAMALAHALANTDCIVSATLYDHVHKFKSPVEILYGDARIPQRSTVLFSGPDVDVFNVLRRRAFISATNDADLEELVFAAQSAGHQRWLSSWIEFEVSSGVPGRIARALTVEGMRDDDQSSALLSCNWGSGFLGSVADKALFIYTRNMWSRFWYKRAICTTSSKDFWEYGVLMLNIVDIRALAWFEVDVGSPLMRRFGGELFERVRSEAEKKTKKRKDTLFGEKKPDGFLYQLLVERSR